MTIRDEAITILRDDFGEGWETKTLAELSKECARRYVLPKVKARRRATISLTSLEAARVAAELALGIENTARRDAEAASDTKAESDIRGL